MTYQSEIQNWRDEQEKRLRSEEGWLTAVGLEWLKPGENSVGSSDRADIILPEVVPVKLGRITYVNGKAQIKFDHIEGVQLDGKSVELNQHYPLRHSDEPGGASMIKVGSVSLFLIQRKKGMGVRIKDKNSKARKEFAGRKWFDVDEKLRIEAKWTSLDGSKKLVVPDMLGYENEEVCPGYATFELEGRSHQLYATVEGDRLFFIFTDKTSGKESYGAARFLFTPQPSGGKVILDFNRTVNPPCAFTEFATCPLAPKENRLSVAIRAGERSTEAH